MDAVALVVALVVVVVVVVVAIVIVVAVVSLVQQQLRSSNFTTSHTSYTQLQNAYSNTIPSIIVNTAC